MSVCMPPVTLRVTGEADRAGEQLGSLSSGSGTGRAVAIGGMSVRPIHLDFAGTAVLVVVEEDLLTGQGERAITGCGDHVPVRAGLRRRDRFTLDAHSVDGRQQVGQ